MASDAVRRQARTALPLVAGVCVCSDQRILLTIAVSAAPPLHQLIHRVQEAGHDCAATVLSGGGLELCGSVIVAAAPANAPELYTVPSIARADLVCSLDFLLREHAPPALS